MLRVAVEFSIDSGASFVPNALFTNLAGNTTYYLVARDAAGKVFTGTANIIEPAEISLSRTITPAECNVFSETGAVQVTVTGRNTRDIPISGRTEAARRTAMASWQELIP